jgi:DNA helicase-2/ATP-dependent DNA helicase PcrA
MSSAPHREHSESARGTAPGRGAGASPEAIEAALAGLDPEQREAVTHGEGPMLIVAGAGTGKTQVITRRIAWLIASRRAKPEEILALTFTNKAAAEMEARVDELVPYGFVGATIATFNAFCDQLVREHAVELGITSQLRVENAAEILVFLREHLFELGLRRYLPLGRPEMHLHALASLFDRARNEDVSSARWLAFAERLAADAGDDPVRRDRAEAEREKAGAYAAFEKLMLEHGRIDFGSQIALALRLLRERPHVLRQVQSSFRWLLVDEFQDTNHAQFEFVKLLAARARGITVVGDDDQSIYRFRGARVENLLEFLETFPGAREVLLRRNYRSGQAILDHAHRLIRHNDPERLEFRRGIDKRLLAQRAQADGRPFEGVVEHRAFQATRDQADIVAGEIADAVAAGVARPSDAAILARSHGSLDPFALALQARGVRFTRVGMRGLYGRPEVRLCLNALRSVADPDASATVYMLLGDERFGADPVDLARLGAHASRTNRPLLRVAAHAAAGDASLAPRTRDAIRRFAELHRELSALAVSRPASEVLYAFVAGSGMLEALGRDESAENVERAQNLNKLFGIVSRVGPLLANDRVDQFIHHLDLLIEMGDDPVAAELEGDEQAVRLLTAHAAKGLEFPVVYMVDLVEQRFPTRVMPNALPFPAELRHTATDEKAEHEREERRLFYVGMTRARDRLVLCHARDRGGVQRAKTSRFVMEALDLPAPPKGATGAGALESIERYAPVAEPEPQPIAPVPPDVAVAISHTSLRAYRDCPWKYYLSRVANVPLPAEPAAMYGRALHHAIRVWHQHRMKGLPIETADVIGAFESAWSSEGFLTPSHEERMLAQGREALAAFVRRDLASGLMPVAIESEFRMRIGRDEIDGRFDRVDERAEGIVLVDYKSSQVQGQDEADGRTEKSLEEGQLGLYALAYRETRGVLPARVELHFVGAGLVGSAAVEPAHADDARARAVAAAEGIRAARFTATPNARTCGLCGFRHLCHFSAARGGA